MKHSDTARVLPTKLTVSKIQRGFFMGGIIAADQRSCACGSTKWANKMEDGHKVPICASCLSYPKLLRVRKYIPGIGPKGSGESFRYDGFGKRITRIHQAISLLEGMNHEIKSGSFRAMKYLPTQGSHLHSFNVFVEKIYLPYYKRQLELEGITQNTMRIKNNLISKHLLPCFGDIQVSQINVIKIEEFYHSYTKTFRQRELAVGELKVILHMAYKHDLIDKVPRFVKLKKANFRNPELFLTNEQQVEILSNIEDPQHRAMIELLVIYGMRPCEVRALKWMDIDHKDKELAINRHCTQGTVVIDGRKSNKEGHCLPLIESAERVLDSIPGTRVPDEFIFKGDRCEIVSERVLLRAWKRAIDKTSIPYIDLYSGTKHSVLSLLLKKGHSESEIIALTGHTNIGIIKRYAQLDKKSKLEAIKKMLTT